MSVVIALIVYSRDTLAPGGIGRIGRIGGIGGSGGSGGLLASIGA